MLGHELLWGYLVHLSFNLWADREIPDDVQHSSYKPDFFFDDSLWSDLLKEMVSADVNLVVIDLGDGVKYESHPEIAVNDAWTVDHLRDELDKMRCMGLEPVPKLNFSTCHDVWLAQYSRCVSTEAYYDVCRDLIAEVIEIFDKPRFFHLGMDEETLHHQRHHNYVVIRQHELWWHDLNFLADEVDRGGARPWIWSDHVWRHPEAFFEKMSKSILQSNWYYKADFSKDITGVKAYLDLEERGYDQIPTGSSWRVPENFEKTVSFCMSHIAPERLLGFLQTSWWPTKEQFRDKHIQSIELVSQTIKKVAGSNH